MAKICSFWVNDTRFVPPLVLECRTMAASGHSVLLLTPQVAGQPPVEEPVPGFRIRRLRLPVSSSHGQAPLAFLRYVWFVALSIVLGVQADADVYVGHDLSGLVPAYIVGYLRKAAVVYRAHELFSEVTHVRWRRLWRLLEEMLVKHVDLVVAPEENRAQIYAREYHANRPPLVVLNCPVLRPLQRGDKLRAYVSQHRHKPFQRICVYAGALLEDSCIRELISAFVQVRSESVLVLVGFGSQRFIEEIAVMIREQDLSQRVLYYGTVPYEDLESILASADVGVVLYRNTGLNTYYCAPNKLYQYLHAGLAVISSDFPGLRAFVCGRQVGLVVDPESPEAIAEAIDQIGEDGQLLRAMSERARRTAEADCNWQVQGEKLLCAYEELANRRA